MRKKVWIALLLSLVCVFCLACSPFAKTEAPGDSDPVVDVNVSDNQQPTDEQTTPEDGAEQPLAANGEEGENEAGESVVVSAEPIVLTISGDAVAAETTWTLTQLQALTDGYREIVYSTTNNWPTYGYMAGHGILLPYLLKQAGLRDNAASFTLVSTDGYRATLTYQQVMESRYSYASHSAAASSGAAPVESIIAWAWGEKDKTRSENIRPMFGQIGPHEVNTAAFVKDLSRIEVSSAYAGAWATPEPDKPAGSAVAAGTLLDLQHPQRDSIRIYYTLDGSEPNYTSAVYNPSTSYFQPQLIAPLQLTKNVTIKAFAAGMGKNDSPVAVFEYTVQ